MGKKTAWRTILGAALAVSGLFSARPALPADEAPTGPWAVYYSDQTPIEAFEPYRLLILDFTRHPPLAPLADRGKTLLGYLSLGEVNASRPYYAQSVADGYVLGQNTSWEGARYVDVRDRRWTSLVIEDLIPSILRQGFHGLFLDTLDSPSYLEREVDPKRYRGMTEAAARLVGAIRRHYPHIPIMVNRAFDLLPAIDRHIDMLMAESLRADHDFQTKRYRMTPEDGYQTNLGLIREARRRRPALMVVSLDYWAPEDGPGIAKLYAIERANGFIPYVATVELDRLVPEPAPGATP